MLISSSLVRQSFVAAQSSPQESKNANSTSGSGLPIRDTLSLGSSSSGLSTNLKWAGIAVAAGAIGYAGSVAHNIPYVGPVVSGVVGAVSGASVGALAGAAAGKHAKLGALAGLVTGAIAGATCGGTLAGNIGMAIAGATVPVGGLVAIFSSAS